MQIMKIFCFAFKWISFAVETWVLFITEAFLVPDMSIKAIFIKLQTFVDDQNKSALYKILLKTC